MAYTFATLKTRVGLLLDDAAGTRWDPTNVVGPFINDALIDFCKRTRCLQKYSTALSAAATTPTSAFYTLPTDCVEILSVVDTVNLVKLIRINVDELPQGWEGYTGQPWRYLYGPFGLLEMRVYPYSVDALTGLKVYYVALAPTLTGTDTPSIPEEYHLALAYYAAAECFDLDQQQTDPAQAMKWRERYEAMVAECAASMARSFDGSARIVPYRSV